MYRVEITYELGNRQVYWDNAIFSITRQELVNVNTLKNKIVSIDIKVDKGEKE